MKYLKHVILLFAVLFLFLAAYNQPKNAPVIAACPSCPGNMRSSDDGMSCIPLCDKGKDPSCPDVSIRCPTLVDAPDACATCPLGWHPAGGDKCISEDMITAISCPAPTPASTATTTTTTLANPASVNCVQNKGGTLEIKKDPEGNEYGVCHLSDGRVCEEWALFREEKCPTCLDYCEGRPHIQCVGTWKTAGTYPDCSCEYSCSLTSPVSVDILRAG